jgi:hypothetical protein
MLVIRDAQMSAMATAREQQFRDNLQSALREHNPTRLDELGAGGAELLVARAIAVATAHGMTWESSIADLAGLMLDIGPEVHRHPRVAAILNDSAHPPDLRTCMLFEIITSQEWIEISRDLPAAASAD